MASFSGGEVNFCNGVRIFVVITFVVIDWSESKDSGNEPTTNPNPWSVRW